MIDRVRNLLEGPGLGAKLVRDIIGSAGLRVIGMGFGFLVGVQLARGLGPAGYGVYGTVMAIIAVLMIPTELGLPQLVTREAATALALDGVGATRSIVSWARRIVVLSSTVIAGAALCVLATGFLDISPPVRIALLIGLIWIPVVAVGNIYGAAIRGMHRIVSGQLGEFLVRPALVSLLLFIVAWQGAWLLSPASAMGINVLGAVVAAGLSVFLLTRAGGMASWAPAPASLQFSHALPLAMSEGMRVLGAQVSLLVLAALASKEDVGLYRVAFGIYTAATMPSALINVVCAPTISQLYAQGKTQSLARLNVWSSVFLLSAAVCFVVLAYLFGSVTVAVLFGSEYVDAASVLLVFLVGEAIASLFGYPVVVLNMMHRQRVVMWWSGVALPANLVISWFLVKSMGYIGAAFGCVAALIIWRAGCAIYAKRNLGLDTGLATKLIPAGNA